MLKKQETGRSMIEMLGVLAVIGVLSVGGIAGYTSAMNKHRANELLNEASKRAVVIVPQIAMGNTPSIAEFTNNDLGYGTFQTTVYGENGTNTWTSTDKKFTLSITGVSEAVCNQMKNTAGGVIKGFKPETCADNATIALTYNNDMSTGDSTSDATGSIDTGTCANGNVYLSYNVGSECDTTTPQNMRCTKNSDCDSGEYCELTGAWQNSCAEITGGTCKTLDAGTPITYTHGGKTTNLLLGGTMSWWAAENWCKAHHKSLVKASTLGCTANGTSGTCPSSVNSDMNSAGLTNYYWAAESFNSSDAWSVGVYFEDFFYYYSRYANLYALCE